jgi:hypothetical protein
MAWILFSCNQQNTDMPTYKYYVTDIRCDLEDPIDSLVVELERNKSLSEKISILLKRKQVFLMDTTDIIETDNDYYTKHFFYMEKDGPHSIKEVLVDSSGDIVFLRQHHFRLFFLMKKDNELRRNELFHLIDSTNAIFENPPPIPQFTRE